MKKIVLFITLIISTIVFPLSQKQKDNDLNSPESYKQLISITLSILEGKDYADIKGNISPEAYIINDGSYENIYEILDNPAERKKFIEGEGIKIKYSHILISKDRQNAYLVLETISSSGEKTNWHTIFLELSKNNKWRNAAWHKS